MGKNILTKELLLKSVQEWNAVRKANPDIVPNLRGEDLRSLELICIDLSKADLRGALLSCADLRKADLSGANLSGADIFEARLRYANLSNANLSQAFLLDADLRGANLINADLSIAYLCDAKLNSAILCGANISRADLRGAHLDEVDFSDAHLYATNFGQSNLRKAKFDRAKIGYTVFGDANLSNAIGLDKLEHTYPSTIGIDTIYLSHGNIPEVFLRGCGVPDNFIDYARSLTRNGIEYYSCFISYSHRNEEFAQRLHNDLQASGVRCWFAPHDLPIGAKTRPAIDDAIRIHDKLLLILSEHSVQSNWVEHEVEHALDLETERGKLVLFPVHLDDAVMDSKTGWASNVKRQRNIGDFTRWKDHDSYQKAFSRLLRDLKQ